MERHVDAAYPIHELLRKRWSPRSFAPRPVAPEQLRLLLEAARWSPSSSNEQPWSYLVATADQAEDHARMLACLVEKNRLWARGAPLLMIAVAARTFHRNGKPNRHMAHDVGLATANLIVQASALDIYVHQMAGFDPEQARTTYGIPDTHEAFTAIALGYLGDPQALPEDFRKSELTPATRKPITEFVFSGRWGATAPWTR
jgi:nitroreductase